jgi:hypothetical protein
MIHEKQLDKHTSLWSGLGGLRSKIWKVKELIAARLRSGCDIP